ncbi:MAG: hypothetical protein ABI624_00780 [Casimicrobiaceae bacterium]
MLHEFLTENRTELLGRCRQRREKRAEAADHPSGRGLGVPLFMTQLAERLESERTSFGNDAGAEPAPAPPAMSRAAAQHGAELLRLGYKVDEVVRDYGDVCQVITGLATEQQASITPDEFRTLNLCLDDAIADAVVAFGAAGQAVFDRESATLQRRLDGFAEEHQRLVNIAIQAYSAIKSGNIGLTGATGSLLVHTLGELRTFVGRTLPVVPE